MGLWERVERKRKRISRIVVDEDGVLVDENKEDKMGGRNPRLK